MLNYLRGFFILLGLNLSIFATVFSQNENSKFEFDAGIDLFSRFIWRGMDLGRSSSIQPVVSVTFTNITFGAFGAYCINGNPYQETDLFIDFKLDNFTISVWDYYSIEDNFKGSYFQYGNDKTFHVFESILLWEGGDKFPFNFMAGYNFLGADKDNSIYCEAVWKKQVNNKEIQLFLGYTPFGGYYGDKAGIVNAGISFNWEYFINQHKTIPLQISLITNPQNEKVFLVAGISL